jgi:hypothetical protein
MSSAPADNLVVMIAGSSGVKSAHKRKWLHGANKLPFIDRGIT